MSIAENLARIKERIHSAAVHRRSEEIQLMGVTKTVRPDGIREAYGAGVRCFGENRVQEFAGKIPFLGDLEQAEWHMIGHLQTNKVSKASELFSHVDSIDSLRLARKLNSVAAPDRKIVLLEINIGNEEAKSGIRPDSRELQELLDAAPGLSFLEFRGLMTVPPYQDDPEQSRPYFRRMRALFEQLAGRQAGNVRMEILSMGMSHDFEIAIEEGATCVRLGTAIFGERPVQRSSH
ncbi:MAG: YggS family pyridoxal phosphate-dependent enzyme [Acidobacteria bacterium]|nr:YggS family pyridoxal phosphate-dependent enzyme [Acidobacteriota bacterium]